MVSNIIIALNLFALEIFILYRWAKKKKKGVAKKCYKV